VRLPVLALAGWSMIVGGLWLGVSLAAALVGGGAMVLAAVVVRVKR